MKEVWIFGDSYSDRDYVDEVLGPNYDYTWPRRLEKEYQVKNFSLMGSGATYAVDALIKQIDQLRIIHLKNVSVIFLMSDTHRLDLSFVSKYEQYYSAFLLDNGLTANGNKELDVKYSKYKKFVQQLFEYYVFTDSYHNTERLKCASVVKHFSPLFEKILFWPIFETIDHIESDENFFYMPQIFSKLENFDFCKNIIDPRTNHMSAENHDIMLEEIRNWIDHGVAPDVSRFKFNP